MADDALTRKEAEMGRLTRDQVELLRAGLLASEWCGYSKRGTVNALCDLALRALSLESVREEALEKVINLLSQEYVGEDYAGSNREEWNAAVGYCIEVILAMKSGSKQDTAQDIHSHTWVPNWIDHKIIEYKCYVCGAVKPADQHAPARVAEGGVAVLRQRMREIFKNYGIGDGIPGWIEHTDQDGKLRRDVLSFEGELIFGIEALLEKAPESPAKEQPWLKGYEAHAIRMMKYSQKGRGGTVTDQDKDCARSGTIIMALLRALSIEKALTEFALDNPASAKEQPGERRAGKYRLVYNKVTRKIDKISNFDGLAVESFDPPTDCDFTLPPPPERP